MCVIYISYYFSPFLPLRPFLLFYLDGFLSFIYKFGFFSAIFSVSLTIFSSYFLFVQKRKKENIKEVTEILNVYGWNKENNKETQGEKIGEGKGMEEKFRRNICPQDGEEMREDGRWKYKKSLGEKCPAETGNVIMEYGKKVVEKKDETAVQPR